MALLLTSPLDGFKPKLAESDVEVRASIFSVDRNGAILFVLRDDRDRDCARTSGDLKTGLVTW